MLVISRLFCFGLCSSPHRTGSWCFYFYRTQYKQQIELLARKELYVKEFRTWLFRMCIYGLLIRLAWFPLFDGTLHDNSPSTPTSTTRCWIQHVLASMGWICLRCSWIRRIPVTERLLEPETIGFESKTIVFEITTKGETSFICESRFLAVSCLFLSVGVSFIVLGFLFCSSHGYVLCRFCIMFCVYCVHDREYYVFRSV